MSLFRWRCLVLSRSVGTVLVRSRESCGPRSSSTTAAAAHICLRRARFVLGVTVNTAAVSKILLLSSFVPTLSSYNLFSITWRSLFRNVTRGCGSFPSADAAITRRRSVFVTSSSPFFVVFQAVVVVCHFLCTVPCHVSQYSRAPYHALLCLVAASSFTFSTLYQPPIIVVIVVFPGSFFICTKNLNETCNESWIIFASLYGKPRVARNGNFIEVNFRGWKNLSEVPRTICTQFPAMEIILLFFSFHGNCVQFVTDQFFHGRKFISS